jgi:GNAT superfamily N-acetyltransferase
LHEKLLFHKVTAADTDLIGLIAQWYESQWHIPLEKTRQRLGDVFKDGALFQLVLKKGEEPIATGGLYREVGLHAEHPRFKELSPWVALLYVVKESRNQGVGEKLLAKIETMAKEAGFSKIHLYTFTAENFYIRNGWRSIEKVKYKGHDTAVMIKEV